LGTPQAGLMLKGRHRFFDIGFAQGWYGSHFDACTSLTGEAKQLPKITKIYYWRLAIGYFNLDQNA
jgi:hypothetical protein